MKNHILILFLAAFLLGQNLLLAQYAEREDVVWARTVPAGTITLDGNLNETAWSQAETVNVIYGQEGPLPTSAWRPEFQEEAITDPTNATVKFLVSSDNNLYLGFNIPDSSVGGNQDWARWDAILMSIKDKLDTSRAAPAVEYFYSWWYVNIPTYIVPGAPPRFVGRYGNFDDTTRTPEQRAAWDAVTIVNGTSNDAGRDQGWVVEMRVDLTVLGYNVAAPEGDIIAMNFSIWDCDFLFEGDPSKVTSARTWFQSPWGNANAMNVARVFARPDITTTSATLPVIPPDVVVTNGSNHPEPVIDGNLNEAVWQDAPSFDIAWGDNELRNSYPTTGPLSSGQFQPELGGNPRPPVLDPAFATIKMFFRDNFLYLAADVDDQLVQGFEEFDRIDGVSFIIGDREEMSADNNMVFQRLRASFDAAGQPAAYDYLTTLVDSNLAQFAIGLKGATTVNVNSDIDEGYQVEMRVDLTALGYPTDLGDKLLFMGVMLADGDSFEDPLNNYGTRTWWFREHDGGPAAAWMVMDPNILVAVDDNQLTEIPEAFEIYGNYPNPFNPSTTITFAAPERGNVTVTVYNSIGEMVKSDFISLNSGGTHKYRFNAANISSGAYFYKITYTNYSGTVSQSSTGKMILMK
jgi:hypothetical protein